MHHRLKSTKHRLARLTVAIALLAAGGTASMLSATAASAASCSGFSCHGYDPVAEGCSTTSTTTAYASSGGVTYATLWNRYSAGCKANWSRAELTSAAISAGYTMLVLADTSDSRGNYEDMCWPGPNNNVGALNESCGNPYGGSSIAYTDMVDGTNTADAYVYIYNSSGNLVTYAVSSQ
jgi:hypothetical protein